MQKASPILPLTFLSLLLLIACSPAAPSTPDMAQVQATAVSMAMTMAAQPTATPLPTETPSPTPLPSPTLTPTEPPTPLPTPTNTAAACDKPLSSNPAGTIAEVILIRNESGGGAQVSLWLAPTAFGECGYRGFQIAKGDTVSTALPLGCYTATAYITTKDRHYSLSQGALCFNNTDKWTFVIRPNRIVLLPP